MSTAKVIHVVASSSQSFDDAVQRGLGDAARTLRGISGLKITDFTAKVENDKITSYKVTMDVAFAIEEG